MKKVLASMLVMVIAFPLAASAQEIEKEIAVTGGSLQFAQTRLSFNDITLSSRDNLKSQADSFLRAIDDRGNGAGWAYSVAATDFVTTMDGQEFKLPASIVQFTTTLKNTISGVPIDFTQGGELAQNKVLSSVPSTIVSADVGKGQGAYDFEVNYILSLPKTMTNSEGAEIGVIAGTYKSVFTYTATSGI
ncbi:WxL domain-containing protein (plasmid) [Paenibacillus urinalis]|uniref:WxL domain-containing protein n=2 Tax=Paenibacillus urinalis TaxID=521520 RepID=A0AAX3N6U2_9BACL|nr:MULTISPECIES: WxL domain-containing protein [Paenibacillus]MCM3130491.1 WxL domain-containing protein [Paenibacillus sp. MER 78]WDH85378.1 WxL domain-containing protein [Paenibacillus urinalis]WDH95184.1 WxL domain-containing protein [Paenibacillus urinalis]WDI05342.1 WxL domain-containing protein [Paenibacillus urinalis]